MGLRLRSTRWSLWDQAKFDYQMLDIDPDARAPDLDIIKVHFHFSKTFMGLRGPQFGSIL